MAGRTDKADKVKEITDKLHESVKALFEGEKYKNYLSCMSKFTNLSFNNTVLVAMQRPDICGLTAGYKAWTQKFDRHVVSGAKGIQIIQPAPWKKKEQVEVKNPDGSTMLKDGKPVVTEVERIMPGFKIGYVYAYEDTEGTPLPSLVDICDKKVENEEQFIEALKAISPAPIIYENLNTTANGYYSLTDRVIHVDADLPPLQKIKTTIHELGHCLLHDRMDGTDVSANRREREVSAESVAFTVLSYYNLDSSEYSFGYIAGYSANKSLEELTAKMIMIKETAGKIIDMLDAEFLKMKMAEAKELTFKNGQEYFYIYKEEIGYKYSVYDMDFKELSSGKIDDANIAIDTAAEVAMEQTNFRKEFASLYNDQALKNKISQVNNIVSAKSETMPETAIMEPHHVQRRI